MSSTISSPGLRQSILSAPGWPVGLRRALCTEVNWRKRDGWWRKRPVQSALSSQNL